MVCSSETGASIWTITCWWNMPARTARSRQFYNGILDNQSHGVFHGRIIVHKDAQKTDAKQTNRNLLLSDDAQIDTKPQLEIYADDVKCTHGATIGQIEENALFYLRSRGIDEISARRLLLQAFAGECLDRMPEHKQVLVGKLTQMAASKAPLELLQGAAKLEESFDIEPTPGKGRGVGGVRLLTLLPKAREGEAGRSLQRIVLEVFPKTYFIRTISLYEVSGNVASFEFSSPQSNMGLGDSLFDLKLPADVEVVRAPVLNGP